jgi:hypothetical protein
VVALEEEEEEEEKESERENMCLSITRETSIAFTK